MVVDPWLTPAGARAADQSAAAAWRRHGRGAQWVNPAVQPRIAITFDAWGWPIWQANATTPRRRVFRCPANYDSPGYYEAGPSASTPSVIPWGAGFRGAAGEDGGCLIEVVDQRDVWVEALGIREANFIDRFLIDWRMAMMGLATRTRPGDLIADALNIITPANEWAITTQGGGKLGGKHRGILCADDFARPDGIGHALQLTGLTQFGPGARFVSPVTRVEHPGKAPNGYPAALTAGDNPKVAPAGTRFRLAMSDDDIAQHVTRRGLRDPLASTVAKLIRCARDFGFIHGSDTGVGDPSIVATGTANPAEAAKWRALGVTSESVAVNILADVPWEKLEVVS